jgi:hypothetical protein
MANAHGGYAIIVCAKWPNQSTVDIMYAQSARCTWGSCMSTEVLPVSPVEVLTATDTPALRSSLSTRMRRLLLEPGRKTSARVRTPPCSGIVPLR